MEQARNGESSRTVLVRIRSVLPALRPSERAIADVVLAEPSRVAAMSIGDVAELCGTSTTSVVRFYKKIGYSGYSDFRLDLARETARESLANNVPAEVYEDIDQSDSLQDVVSKIAFNETMSIADTAQMLDIVRLSEAVAALSNARKTDIFGVGAGALVAQDMQQKLHRIGKVSFSWSEAHAAWTSAALLDPTCVSVAISHSGTTMDTVEFVNIAKEAGAVTIAITNHADSPLGRAADIVLSTAARESPFRPGALGSRIAQMMVIDCLFVGVAQRSYDASIDALRKTHAVIRSRRLPSNAPAK
ncbi:MurR/RpiR family transcriptional regulator [Arthrobacter sp. CJ23]|uniref:MurR/RpiR family transcriptional regulator n=1 Tax=Arthrobacter sp. CJ23 TaxID=2972479 RepID=UPI00215B8AB6|nr:MurR/RpiR family transcriptional regulator [Arthrobacter sp. CJ23]UVJ40278.1 MurR/RpiR family transcriptional regulator [Arthrobacter sp. CJ23]